MGYECYDAYDPLGYDEKKNFSRQTQALGIHATVREH